MPGSEGKSSLCKFLLGERGVKQLPKHSSHTTVSSVLGLWYHGGIGEVPCNYWESY